MSRRVAPIAVTFLAVGTGAPRDAPRDLLTKPLLIGGVEASVPGHTLYGLGNLIFTANSGNEKVKFVNIYIPTVPPHDLENRGVRSDVELTIFGHSCRHVPWRPTEPYLTESSLEDALRIDRIGECDPQRRESDGAPLSAVDPFDELERGIHGKQLVPPYRASGVSALNAEHLRKRLIV